MKTAISFGRKYKSDADRSAPEDVPRNRVKVLTQLLRAQGWENHFVDIDNLISEGKFVCEDVGVSYKRLLSLIERMRAQGMIDVVAYQVGSESFGKEFVGYGEIPIYGTKIRVTLKGLEFLKKFASNRRSRNLRQASLALGMDETLKQAIKKNIDGLIENEKRRLEEQEKGESNA